MNHFLKNQSDITAWLDRHGVKNYTLIPNPTYGYMVDVEGEVNLSHKNLSSIDVKFNHVQECFYCCHNELTTLLGCPHTVDSGFYCHHNRLSNLVGGPQSVGGIYSCQDNLLTSLLGAPQIVDGHFNCSDNKLTSLQSSPNTVGNNFYCIANQLESLMGCPNRIEGGFACSDNKIVNLEYFPQSVGGHVSFKNNPDLGDAQYIESFTEIYRLHQEFIKIKEITEEKHNLEQITDNHTHVNSKTNFKI